MAAAADAEIVFFSVETTCFSLKYEQQVINIAACRELEDGAVFNVYVKPTCPIMSFSTERCGLREVDDKMYLNNEIVDALHPKTALQMFISCLKFIGKPVILVSYGNFYDAEKIVEMAISADLITELKDVALGFVDLMNIYIEKGVTYRNHLEYFAEDKLGQHYPIGTASQRVSIFQKLLRMEGDLSVSQEDLTNNLRMRSVDMFIMDLETEEGNEDYVPRRYVRW